ncbi:MAG: hypothetical protein JXJ04_11190 [Spirochaetales bacterium]|nr:hypothetical protein [Spirochaetales bacterium]
MSKQQSNLTEPGRAFIAGISTGANIALLMASYYPDYVEGVLAMVPFGVISGISLSALLKILLLNINYSEKKQAALFRYLNGQPLSGKGHFWDFNVMPYFESILNLLNSVS